MAPRYGHHIFVDPLQDFLILHSGHTRPELQKPSDPGSVAVSLSTPDQTTTTETWLYDFSSQSWTSLPHSPATPVAAAYSDTTLYTISRSADSSALSGAVHYLRMLPSATERQKPGALAWQTVDYPANPLTPGPRPREGGALIPLHTGHGRSYLIYMFGCADSKQQQRQDDGSDVPFYSDIWSLQLPSYGFTAAAAKDKILGKLPGLDSGEFSWPEAEIGPTEQMQSDGKVHPGPRALFGADVCLDGKGVIMWGGVNAKGEKEADGWFVGLAYGYADNDRYE